MKWQEIRQQFPQKWLLIESTNAYTMANKHRVIEQITVISHFDDFYTGMKVYKKLHQANPYREMYVVHTDRQSLDVEERYSFSPRFSRHYQTTKA